jgi:hypothetical protein
MLLTVQQSYDLLARHGVYAKEICDKCGAVLGAVRYTRKDEPGVWCSGECRGDGERIRKNGRPRKYRNGEESRAAKARQQRNYRLRSDVRSDVEKTVCIGMKTKGLQTQKTPLSHYPLMPSLSTLERAANAKRCFGILFAIFLGLCFCGAASAQGVMAPSKTVFGTVNAITRPIAGATITVCAASASGIPCSPVLIGTIFKDAGLTQPLTNPFTADANGNYQFAAASGAYTVTETASGFSGYSYQLSLSPSTASTNTWTQPQTFSQPIVSAVAIGTAPFIIASTTQVSNLNAQLHGGLSAPGSAIVGVSDSQALTNKTITAPVVTSPSTTGTDSGAETLQNKTFDISANTFKNSTNTAGHYSRNNGTQYVDSTMQGADIPATTSNCSGVQFAQGLNAGHTPICATPPTFGASGASHAVGYVPDPGSSAGTTRFLREDATWVATSGVPVVAVNLTAQQADIPATTLTTPGANGFYRFSCWLVVTQRATTSATLPSCQVIFNDADTNVGQTVTVTNGTTAANPIVGSAGLAVTTPNGEYPSFFAKSGVAIQYQTLGYASAGATPMQFAIHIRLEGPF